MSQNEDAQQPAWLVECLREEGALRANPFSERLREDFLPVVEQLGETLPLRFSERNFWVHDDAINHPDYQGYHIEIESSIFSLAGWNTVVLVLGLSQLTSTPQLLASVYWLP